MTIRRALALAVLIVCLGNQALAQEADVPLANWIAPPYWTPPAAAAAGPGQEPGAMHASAQGMQAQAESLPSQPLPFTAITPCRVADTRGNGFTGAYGPPSLLASSTRDFPIGGQCGIPANAVAVSFNFTVVNGTQNGDLRFYPTGGSMPLVSTINWKATTGALANAAIVPLGTSGSVTVKNDCIAAIDLVIDVNGYYGPTSVVTSLNALTGDVTLAQGANVTITPSGNTLTIAATGGPGGVLPAGSANQTLYNNGSAWTASSALTNNGTNVAIANNLLLPNTGSGGASGVIELGGTPFLHNYGSANTFVGQSAGNFTMTGSANTASGYASLASNTLGISNTASGALSLTSNTTGYYNTASGMYSLPSNTTANYNTASGASSLYSNTTGIENTAIGANAGARSDTINAYGSGTATFVPGTTGSYNTFVGYGTGATVDPVSNCTAVGIDAYCTGDNQVRLGNTNVGSIGGKVGWSALSDIRAKRDVRDLDLGLEFVMRLRPVAYTLRNGNGKTDMGFVAQDIEVLLGDSYNVLDIGGDPQRTLSLRHADLIAPLVKAVQQQQAELSAQRAEIAALKRQLAAADALRARVDELAAEVRRLAAREPQRLASAAGD